MLLAACERLEPTFSSLRPAEALTPYAVEVRYGDPAYFPTLEETAEAARLAGMVDAFVRDRFAADGLTLPSSTPPTPRPRLDP